MKLSPVPLIRSQTDTPSTTAPPAKRPRLDPPVAWAPQAPAAAAWQPAPPTPLSRRAGEQSVGKVWIVNSRPLPTQLHATVENAHSAAPLLVVHLPTENGRRPDVVRIAVSPQTVQMCGTDAVVLRGTGCSRTGRSWYFTVAPAGTRQSPVTPQVRGPVGAPPPAFRTDLHFACIQDNPLERSPEALYLRRRLDAGGTTLGFTLFHAHLAHAQRLSPASITRAHLTTVEVDAQLRVERLAHEDATVRSHATHGFHELAEFYANHMDGALIAQPHAASLGLLQILGRKACGETDDVRPTREGVARWYGGLKQLIEDAQPIAEVASA